MKTNTEHEKVQGVPTLPCPLCVEAAVIRIGGAEMIPKDALQRYTYDQLSVHLESDMHIREEFILVALKASATLYRRGLDDTVDETEGLYDDKGNAMFILSRQLDFLGIMSGLYHKQS
jgi:hypothetical protein